MGDVEISDRDLLVATLAEALYAIADIPCETPYQGETEQAACDRKWLTELIMLELLSCYASIEGIEVDSGGVKRQLDEWLRRPGVAQALATAGLFSGDLEPLGERVVLRGQVQDSILPVAVDGRIRSLAREASIEVDPTFGRWDADLALVQPATPAP